MKDKTTAGLLALLLGGLGVHKFYLGEKGGIWYLLFSWTFIPVILALIDGIKLLGMSEDKFDSIYNQSKVQPSSGYSFLPPIINAQDEDFRLKVFKTFNNTDYSSTPANDAFMRMVDNYLSYMNTANNAYLEAFKNDERVLNGISQSFGDAPRNYGAEIHKMYKEQI